MKKSKEKILTMRDDKKLRQRLRNFHRYWYNRDMEAWREKSEDLFACAFFNIVIDYVHSEEIYEFDQDISIEDYMFWIPKVVALYKRHYGVR